MAPPSGGWEDPDPQGGSHLDPDHLSALESPGGGRTRRVSSALLLLLTLGACRPAPAEPPLRTASDRSENVRAAVAAAVEANQRGNLPLTIQHLREAHQGAPDDLDIALDLGDTLNRAGRNESARAHYVDFLARHPSADAARLAYGLTLMGLGRWEDAAAELQSALARSPADAGTRRNLGTALVKLGRYAEAVPQLQEAARLVPGDAVTLTELGLALMRLDRTAEAAVAFESAIAAKPYHVPALFNLGQCYARLGRTADAQAALEKFAQASRVRERFIDQKRLFRAAQGRADSLVRAGNPEKALEALLNYRAGLEDFPPFHQELGVAYLRLGRRAEAVAALERAVALDPELTEAHADLASLYQQSGETEKAMRSRQAAARGPSAGAGPEHPPERSPESP